MVQMQPWCCPWAAEICCCCCGYQCCCCYAREKIPLVRTSSLYYYQMLTILFMQISKDEDVQEIEHHFTYSGSTNSTPWSSEVHSEASESPNHGLLISNNRNLQNNQPFLQEIWLKNNHILPQIMLQCLKVMLKAEDRGNYILAQEHHPV